MLISITQYFAVTKNVSELLVIRIIFQNLANLAALKDRERKHFQIFFDLPFLDNESQVKQPKGADISSCMLLTDSSKENMNLRSKKVIPSAEARLLCSELSSCSSESETHPAEKNT